MRKYTKIKEHLTNADIYICYGKESYNLIQKKLNIVNKKELDKNGFADEIQFDSGYVCYIVSVNDNTENILHIKSTIVHELSHIVSYIMDRFGFECDEFRSYLLSYLYEYSMVFIDKLLTKDNNEDNKN